MDEPRDDENQSDLDLDGDEATTADDAAASHEPEPWDLEHVPPLGPVAAEGPTAGVAFAELPLRALALVIDVIVAQFLADVGYRIGSIIVLTQSATTFPDGSDSRLIVAVVAALLSWTASAFVYVYFIRRLRATPGQMFLGLFTLRADGRRLGTSTALLRWFLVIWPATLAAPLTSILNVFSDPDLQTIYYVVVTIGPVAWIGFLAVSILRDPRGRGLHDQLTHAVVVRRAGSPS